MISPTDRIRAAMNSKTKDKGDELISQNKEKGDLHSRNDYGVGLMFVGQYGDAIKIFEEIEKKEPGLYMTAANMGTAYELSGDNQKALKWIEEGIQRNRESHLGTEWLHAQILRAEIRERKSPGYLATNGVLGVNFSLVTDKDATFKFHGKERTLSQVERSLKYQLVERVQFVKPKDAVVAILLKDYADITSLTRSLESARPVYDLALQYGHPAENEIYAIIQANEKTIAHAKAVRALVAAVFLAGLAAFLLYALKKRWMRLA